MERNPRGAAWCRKNSTRELKPPPVKPWSARSLVGATMGARKRHARQSRALRFAKNHPHLMKPGAFERGRGSLRIGERLRPCPGNKHILWRTRRWVPAADCKLCSGKGVVKTPIDRSGPLCPGCCNCAIKVCKKRDADGFCTEKYMHCTDGVLPARVREVPHA